jgi:hypothetical protein
MKKRLLLIAGLVVLVLISLVGIALVRANDVVKLLQPQIEEQLAKAVGAPVKISAVEISLFPSVQLVVSNVSMGDPSAPSVAALKAKLALRPLLNRKLDASEIRIEQPKITFTKSREGFSVVGLSRQDSRSPQAPSSPSPGTSAAPESSPSSSTQKSLQLHLERLVIEGGTVTLKDVDAGTTSSLSNVDLDAEVQLQGALLSVPQGQLRFKAPGDHSVSLAIRSGNLNRDTNELSVSEAVVTSDAGKVRADATLQLATRRGKIRASSERLDLSALARYASTFAPTLSNFSPTGTLIIPKSEVILAGANEIALNSIIQLRDASMMLPGGKTVQVVNGDISVDGTTTALRFVSQKLSLALNRAPITLALDGQFTVGTPSSLALTRLNLDAFEGSGSVPFTLKLSSPQQIRASADLKGLSIQSLLSTLSPERADNLSGTIASLSAQVSGPLGPQAPNLRGPGNISVRNAALKGFNLPQVALSSIGKGLPFLEEPLVESVPQEFQGILREPDTRIKSLDSSFELQGDRTLLRSLEAVGEIFSLNSSGSIARDGTLDLAMTLTFTPEFSQALARRVKDIGKVYDSAGRLVIPLTLKGRSPKLVVLPDLPKLMQTGAGRIIEREAGRAIEKALGKDSDTARGVKDLLGGLLKR